MSICKQIQTNCLFSMKSTFLILGDRAGDVGDVCRVDADSAVLVSVALDDVE